MRTILVSAAIGIVAGCIDILPMILQKLDARSIVSAFLQYFFVAIIIVNIDLFGIVWWLQGAVISFSLALPVVVIVSAKDKKAVLPIMAMSLILGTLISAAGHFLK
jgi:hypothetical protein